MTCINLSNFNNVYHTISFVNNVVNRRDYKIKLEKPKATKVEEPVVSESEVIDTTGLSKQMKEAINVVSKNDVDYKSALEAKAVETNQWIRYTIYYMTDTNAEIATYLDDETKELVNAVSNMAGFGTIYKGHNVIDVDKIDITNIKEGEKHCERFLLNKPELVDFLRSKEFRKIMHNRMFKRLPKRLADGSEYPQKEVKKDVVVDVEPVTTESIFKVVDDDQENKIVITDPSVPVIPEKPKKGANMDTATYVKMENIFSKFIHAGLKHRYENENGDIHLYISRDGGMTEECYIVDDGTITGGTSVSIMAHYLENGTPKPIFVDVLAHPAITTKILKSAICNFLTPEEYQEVYLDFISNYQVYRNIDFNGTEFFDELSNEDKNKLEVSLLGVLQVLKFTNNENVRLKFGQFNGAENFSLVSTYDNIRRPFCYMHGLQYDNTYVLEGLEVKVVNKIISVIYNGNVTSFTMS